jgi:hypothetical protein
MGSVFFFEHIPQQPEPEKAAAQCVLVIEMKIDAQPQRVSLWFLCVRVNGWNQYSGFNLTTLKLPPLRKRWSWK